MIRSVAVGIFAAFTFGYFFGATDIFGAYQTASLLNNTGSEMWQRMYTEDQPAVSYDDDTLLEYECSLCVVRRNEVVKITRQINEHEAAAKTLDADEWQEQKNELAVKLKNARAHLQRCLMERCNVNPQEKKAPAEKPQEDLYQAAPASCEQCDEVTKLLEANKQQIDSEESPYLRSKLQERRALLLGMQKECFESHCPTVQPCEYCAHVDAEIRKIEEKMEYETGREISLNYYKSLEKRKKLLEQKQEECTQYQCEYETTDDTEGQVLGVSFSPDVSKMYVAEAGGPVCVDCIYPETDVELYESALVYVKSFELKQKIQNRIDELKSEYYSCMEFYCPDIPAYEQSDEVCDSCKAAYHEKVRVSEAYDRAYLPKDRAELKIKLDAAIKTLESCMQDQCK